MQGDPDDTSHRGHPLCKFCDERYLDNDELLKHLRRDHLLPSPIPAGSRMLRECEESTADPQLHPGVLGNHENASFLEDEPRWVQETMFGHLS